MSSVADTDIRKAMGRRLARVRRALGLTQAQIVASVGVSVTGWSAWEGGRNTINFVQLAKVAQRRGFDTNYVSTGDLSGVPKKLADKIEAMEMREASVPVRPGKGRPPSSRDRTDGTLD